MPPTLSSGTGEPGHILTLGLVWPSLFSGTSVTLISVYCPVELKLTGSLGVTLSPRDLAAGGSKTVYLGADFKL